jgi:hypothetical protein
MLTIRQKSSSLYVDRASQQWIVRDGEGAFWVIPASGDAWSQRRPYTPSEACELQPIPGHYKALLGLPF